MSGFTVAYLVRLEGWGVLAVLAQGVLVRVSWRAWQHAITSPQIRHRLACMHFVALGLLPLATLAVLQSTVIEMAARPPRELPIAALPTTFDALSATLALAVAGAWGAGVAAMLARLALDARALARLRHAPAPAQLVAALRRSARRGGVGALPRIREAAVSSPQVAGWRRPLLLVPRGLARRLAAAELEAVLLHELAHVRRGDIGWNVLQRVLLALLWFHPAAWRLQGDVARERERCCDAFAVRHGASPAALARALVKLAEARPALALGVADRGGLLERVRDLLEPARRDAPAGGRFATAAGWSTLCLVALGAGRCALADPLLGDFYMASAFGPTIAIQAHDAAGDFALRVRQGQVIEASIAARPMRVVQQGERVTLTDAARAPMLVLTVLPQGRVMWEARR